MKHHAAHPRNFTRRQFMGHTAFATAAFSVVPGAVLGLNGATSPNEKLNLAGIGFGGRGADDLAAVESENIVALCDVDHRHAAHVFKKYPKARQHEDYRKMLDDQKEIDAVVIATPDHHHAFASMAGINRGKHVYCEKPLTHSVWEARQVAQAARARRVATQMGNQGQASEQTRRLCEYVWNGAIGSVREVHIWTDRPCNGLFNVYWPQGVKRPQGAPPVPDTLNWDLWLGPAPQRPYHPAYLPFVWRGWWDFGTGALGDIGCHAFDPVFRALKLGPPRSVQASSTLVNKETYPVASMVTYEFPARPAAVQAINEFTRGLEPSAAGGVEMPEVKFTWYDGGLRPPRPAELEDGAELGDNGNLLVGDRGKILTSHYGFHLLPESRRKDFPPPPRTIARSVGHHREWIAACKGGPRPGSNFDWAGPLAEAVLLGNIALRVELREELTFQKLLWDSANLRFTNSDKANQFIRNQYRQDWSLT